MDIYKRIGAVCRMIPEGAVASYGQIALLCGKPRNARQVGYALNRGLAGQVPAHRVVNGRGLLSGAASFETCDMQKILLEGENIDITRKEDGWHVNLARYGWKHTLEDAFRLEERFREEGI